jgi:DNA-binding transcriptional LysR family regulator
MPSGGIIRTPNRGKMCMDKLVSIKVFLQVVRAGSFIKAAEQLGLSQTSASRMVRELEETVGVRLLNRSTRSLSLTDVGDRLFTLYGQVIDDIEGMEAEAAGSGSSTTRSRLRVALPYTFATRRLEAAICRFREEHPTVDLEIRLDDSPTDLVRHGFDLSIRIAPALALRRLLDGSPPCQWSHAPHRPIFSGVVGR